jgi:elongation factor 2
VDHGKTTMSDSLLAAAGLLSPTVAGEALALDYMELEQQRQMTIKAANISLYHEINGIPYLINLHDTPGHIDFTGNVTRSLRAIDGAVVVVDAVEGVMIQTETVTRQALDERVRPMLFINKIDRLVKELRLTPDQILKTLTNIIRDFNQLIELYCESEFREGWRVDPLLGTVVFGCAKDRWAFTYDIMSKKGLKFSDIVIAYTKGEEKGLSEQIPLHDAVLGMVVTNVPPPYVSQKYRIPKIWKGDLESDVGKALLSCDEKGPAVMATTHIRVDPSAGIVATGRLFSGTMTEGDEIYMINSRRNGRIQQVGLYMGPFREVVGSLPAGNIPALLGLGEVRSGETIASLKDIPPFETVHYVSETVMTLAIEPKHPKDLPKLVDVMRRLSIEDPNIKTKIEEKTGEFLISGMGQLHLEIATTLIRKEGLDIITSEPIVVYRESARDSSGEITARSPNGHNKISAMVEPLEDEVMKLLANGEISEMMDRKLQASLLRKAGWEADDAKGVWSISDSLSIFVDATKGVQRLEEVGGSLRIGFMDAVTQGVLAREPVRGLKVKLTDASVHEDPAHHGPAQMIPAMRRAIYAATLLASPVLLEPILRLDVRTSADLVGTITRIVSQLRGKVLNVEQKEHLTYIVGEVPAAETSNLAEVIRSSTGGRAFWDTSFYRWEAVPASISSKVITDIRKRKGLPLEVPKVEDFLE